jgi:hypothetical protein
LPRRLPHQFFFIVQLRIKIDKVYAAVSSHAVFLISGDPGPVGANARSIPRRANYVRPVFQDFSGKILCGLRRPVRPVRRRLLHTNYSKAPKEAATN